MEINNDLGCRYLLLKDAPNALAHYAVNVGDLEVLRHLYVSGYNYKQMNAWLLEYAVANKHTDVVYILIEYGDNKRVDLNHAMRVAAKYGQTDLMRQLIEDGACVGLITPSDIVRLRDNGMWAALAHLYDLRAMVTLRDIVKAFYIDILNKLSMIKQVKSAV